MAAAIIDSTAGDLQRLRERLHLIGTVARFGLWEYDFRDDSLWVSDELAALYGMEPGDLSWPEFASRIHPDDRVKQLERPTPSFPFGEVNEFLIRVRHVDGTYRHIRSRSTTYGTGEVPERKLGVHFDLSNDSVFKLARLSEANDRLRQFTYMASHDLRSPLRAIRGLVSIIEADHGESLHAEVSDLLSQMADRAQLLDRMVTDTLDYAAADLEDVRPAPTDLDELLETVVASTDHRQCRVRLCSTVDGPVSIAGCAVAGCVRNLLDNACKYHDKPAGEVSISASATEDWLRIEVSDDGPGIPESIRAKMFEPFRTSDRKRGTGLGLAHVRHQVDKHNAAVDVVSDPPNGTTITLRWPLGDSNA